MRSRYIRAIIGFIGGLGAALVLGSLLQADSGNTYQVFRGGLPGEIYTASWSRGATSVLVLILGAAGLVWGYNAGMKGEGFGTAGQPLPSRGWDLGLVALVAVLSSPLGQRLGFLMGGSLDLAQVALVAAAVLLGSGTGLLAGGAGLAMGSVLVGSAGWFPLVLGAFGGLEGVLVARLARSSLASKLLIAGAAATFLAVLPYMLVGGALRSNGGPLLRLVITRALVSAALGMLIGWLARRGHAVGAAATTQ